MIKYALVEDRWLIDDLEDEFKTTCGSLMRPTESDGFHTELGVGSAIINPDRDGPVSNGVIYWLVRQTSEEVSLDGARYVKSITKIEDPDFEVGMHVN